MFLFFCRHHLSVAVVKPVSYYALLNKHKGNIKTGTESAQLA